MTKATVTKSDAVAPAMSSALLVKLASLHPKAEATTVAATIAGPIPKMRIGRIVAFPRLDGPRDT